MVSSCGQQPFVSVIIPVLDDQERLDACLEALEHQTYPRDAFEIIVVDNASSPPMRIAEGRARLLVEPRPGSYAARNTGIAAARGEVIAFTDADCLPLPDWIEAGVRLVAETGAGLVAGDVQLFCQDRERPTAAEAYALAWGFPQRRFAERDHFGATANLFATREAIAAVGGFDASLLSAGDVDFGERARAAGYRVIYGAEAGVRHPARRSMKNLLMSAARSETGMKQLAKTRGRRHPAGRAQPLALRLAALSVIAATRPSELEPGQRIRAAAATAAVELVRTAARLAFDSGMTFDVRRFWGK